MKPTRILSLIIALALLTATLTAWPVTGSASTHIANEWTYESSILVRCLPKPPRELGEEFNPYKPSDFPEIEQDIDRILIMEKRTEFEQLLIVLNRNDMDDDYEFGLLCDALETNPNLYGTLTGWPRASITRNDYMYGFEAPDGGDQYTNQEIFYSEDLSVYPSFVPYDTDLFEKYIDIVPDTVNVRARQDGYSYAYVATGLSNYFELCYIINRIAHLPGCNEVYMHQPVGKWADPPPFDAEHTVTLLGNGGSPSSITIEIDDGEPIISPPSFTLTDYYHIGWNTKADGSGTQFEVGAEGIPVYGDIMLYAV